MRLVIAVGVSIAVIYLAQKPIEMIPAFKTYSDAVDKYDLVPGALYYTDVPIRYEAEQHVRAAVKAVDDKRRSERAARNAQK